MTEQPATPHAWWDDRHPGSPGDQSLARRLPRIRVRGNRFVDGEDRPVLFRGFSISDPDKIERQGRWNRQLFVHAHAWGARLIRIPVHPVSWRSRTPAGYLALLDQAVAWCSELGIHLLIDWHSIGNLPAGLFQDPMYDTTVPETFQFWRTIAKHFAGHQTVAFYELFNEPTLFNGQLGRISWDAWKRLNEDMIGIIRAFDTEVIPLVAGFDWAYDLTPLRLQPIEAEGIGYISHPYSHKRSPPYADKFDECFGFAAGRWPVLATEIGFHLGRPIREDNAAYADMIIPYLEDRGIGWLAWVFDPEWYPALLQSWDTFAPTPHGEFFRDALLAGLARSPAR